jgi:SAM-dependent methyltransferase
VEAPSSFVLHAAERITRASGRRAFDVAMGSGRHAVALAARGFRVFGVDLDYTRVRAAMSSAEESDLRIRGWVADLSAIPLPHAYFDLIVCVRFLDRALFPALASALAPGGLLVYETFTTGQLAHGRGPRSPAHLLRPGELARAFPDLTTVAYEEVDEPDAVARLIARRL